MMIPARGKNNNKKKASDALNRRLDEVPPCFDDCDSCIAFRAGECGASCSAAEREAVLLGACVFDDDNLDGVPDCVEDCDQDCEILAGGGCGTLCAAGDLSFVLNFYCGAGEGDACRSSRWRCIEGEVFLEHGCVDGCDSGCAGLRKMPPFELACGEDDSPDTRIVCDGTTVQVFSCEDEEEVLEATGTAVCNDECRFDDDEEEEEEEEEDDDDSFCTATEWVCIGGAVFINVECEADQCDSCANQLPQPQYGRPCAETSLGFRIDCTTEDILSVYSCAEDRTEELRDTRRNGRLCNGCGDQDPCDQITKWVCVSGEVFLDIGCEAGCEDCTGRISQPGFTEACDAEGKATPNRLACSGEDHLLVYKCAEDEATGGFAGPETLAATRLMGTLCNDCDPPGEEECRSSQFTCVGPDLFLDFECAAGCLACESRTTQPQFEAPCATSTENFRFACREDGILDVYECLPSGVEVPVESIAEGVRCNNQCAPDDDDDDDDDDDEDDEENDDDDDDGPGGLVNPCANLDAFRRLQPYYAACERPTGAGGSVEFCGAETSCDPGGYTELADCPPPNGVLDVRYCGADRPSAVFDLAMRDGTLLEDLCDEKRDIISTIAASCCADGVSACGAIEEDDDDNDVEVGDDGGTFPRVNPCLDETDFLPEATYFVSCDGEVYCGGSDGILGTGEGCRLFGFTAAEDCANGTFVEKLCGDNDPVREQGLEDGTSRDDLCTLKAPEMAEIAMSCCGDTASLCASRPPSPKPTSDPTPKATPEPTPKPTVKPTPKPTARPAEVEDDDVIIIAPCMDSTSWHKNLEPAKDCAWVAKSPAARCLVKGEGAVYGFEECLGTCGACGQACADSAEWHKAGEPDKDCAWVKRVYNRCSVVGEDESMAFTRCRAACQTCDYDACVAGVACGDSLTWHKNNDAGKNCAWASKLPAARCLVKGEGAVYGFEDCLDTCGACGQACVDSRSWFKAGEPEKDCKWVKRLYNRCAAVGDDGQRAGDACRKSCQTCDSTVCPLSS